MLLRIRGFPAAGLGFDNAGPMMGFAINSGGGAQALLALDGSTDLDLGSVVDPDGVLRATVLVGDTAIDVELEGADDADSLDLRFIRPDYVGLKLYHAKKAGPCRARCFDGTVGDPCVDCERDGVTVRICC